MLEVLSPLVTNYKSVQLRRETLQRNLYTCVLVATVPPLIPISTSHDDFSLLSSLQGQSKRVMRNALGG